MVHNAFIAMLLVCMILPLQMSKAQTQEEAISVIRAYQVLKVQGVNSKWNDFAPFAVGNELYFSSMRETNQVLAGENNWKSNAYSAIFKGNVHADSINCIITKIQGLPSQMNIDDHTGPISWGANNTQAFITRVDGGTKKRNKTTKRPKILAATMHDGVFTEFSRLPFQEDAFSYGHAFLGPDNKSLYFASDIPGGYGGKDLYVSTLENGKWSVPRNMGELVNTKGDELYPAILNDTLYFTSNGHEGFGGLDIFYAKAIEGEFAEVHNLGMPINSDQDDYALNFDASGRGGYFTSNRYGGIGGDDIYRFRAHNEFVVPLEATDRVHGYFRYRNLNGDPTGSLRVALVDETGMVIMSQNTDENGFFDFTSIPRDKSYSIRVFNSPDVEMVLLDNEDLPAAYLQQNYVGDFVYRKLPLSQTGTIALVDERDIDFELFLGNLSGKFVYETLALERSKGVVIYLVDDSGNIIMKTVTDENGNFEFKNLPLDGNYFIKTENPEDAATILIFNAEKNVVAELKMDENGIFNYKSLPYQRAELYSTANIDFSKLAMPEPKETIFGRFFYKGHDHKLPLDLEVIVYDSERRMIHETRSDEKGFFFLTNMPSSQYYMFRLNPDEFRNSEDVRLAILNHEGDEVVELVRNDEGFFVFEKVDFADRSLEPLASTELAIASLPKLKNSKLEEANELAIYFRFNSSYITSTSANVLKKIVMKLRKDPNVKLKISSHTDARGNDEYNQKLSDRRAEGVIRYLKQKEIDMDRVTAKGFGEKNLVNDCGDGVECSEEQHELNRRAEFTFY